MAEAVDVLFINPGDRKQIYQDLGDEFCGIDGLRQVFLDFDDFDAAQSVVCAEGDDDRAGIVLYDQAAEATGTAPSCITTDTGIHDLLSIAFFVHSFLQQAGPAFFNTDPVTGAQTVTQY